MKKNLAILGATLVTLGTPMFAFAQDIASMCATTSLGNAEGIICKIYSLVNLVTKLMIVAAVAFFIYSVIKFIRADGEEKDEARNGMMQSIIGFAVILGLWGLVSIVLNTFGVGGGTVNQAAFPTF